LSLRSGRNVILWALLLLFSSAVCLTDRAEVATSSDDFKDLQDVDAAIKAKLDALIAAGIFVGVSENEFGLDRPASCRTSTPMTRRRGQRPSFRPSSMTSTPVNM